MPVPIISYINGAQGLGFGLIISSLTSKYRDLSFLVTFGIQLAMYATTVVYPLSVAYSKYPKYVWLIKLNPMTPIIEFMRYGFLGQGYHAWGFLLYGMGVTIILVILGVLAFNKVEKDFIDTV